ncbi:MAG: Replicative DNA helicase [Syntrophomonadaceae bacterium]|nr:Replicative DNA helicase [Bacillota bacterium]
MVNINVSEKINPFDLFDTDLRPMQYWVGQAEKKIAQWATGIPEGYSTGFKTFDNYFRLVAAEITVIAARPSMGKTLLAMQMVVNVAKVLQKTKDPGVVAVFSAEMTGVSLTIRMASEICGVNIHKLRMGSGTPEEAQRLSSTAQTLHDLPIWIDDGSAPTTQIMYERIARLNENIPVRAMMFDFLELGGDQGKTEDLRLGQIMLALKRISKVLQIPIIVLSQLNRGVEDRANKIPSLADLRYSGQIEQIADQVLLLMRPEFYVERGLSVGDIPVEDHKGIAYASLAKSRFGPPTMLKLAFLKTPSLKFADVHFTHHELN